MVGCRDGEAGGGRLLVVVVWLQSKSIFALVLLWFNYVFIGCFYTALLVYRSGDGGGGAVVVWCGGGGGGVVLVVVEVGRAIPLSSSV